MMEHLVLGLAAIALLIVILAWIAFGDGSWYDPDEY